MRCECKNASYLSLDEYCKHQYGILPTGEIEDLDTLIRISNSSDLEQKNLAKSIIMTSTLSLIEQQIILNPKECTRLTKRQIKNLNPKIKNYARNQVVEQITASYRNVIERYEIQIE